MTGSPSQTFFQAVLVVIPALFFGGVLTGAIPKPDPTDRPRPGRALALLALVVFLPVMIEGQALRGALGLYPGSFWVSISAVYVLGATAVVGVAVVRPWLPVTAPTRRTRGAMLVAAAVLPVLVGSAYMADSIRAVDIRAKAEESGGILDEDALDRFQEVNQGLLRTQIAVSRNLYAQRLISRRRYLKDTQKALDALQTLYLTRLKNNNDRAFRTEP